MSVIVEFTRIDRGNEVGRQIQEYDNLAQAVIDQYAGMDVFDESNPGACWVAMRVICE